MPTTPERLTPLRTQMLHWIADGNVSRGLRADRFDTGGFPHATPGRADHAASWLVSNGYARLPAGRQHDRPFEVTEKGWRVLNTMREETAPAVGARMLTSGGFPYRQHPHEHCGSNSERQAVGDPGHCEDCVSVGHIVAHPDIGCGDVGCNSDHTEQTGA